MERLPEVGQHHPPVGDGGQLVQARPQRQDAAVDEIRGPGAHGEGEQGQGDVVGLPHRPGARLAEGGGQLLGTVCGRYGREQGDGGLQVVVGVRPVARAEPGPQVPGDREPVGVVGFDAGPGDRGRGGAVDVRVAQPGRITGVGEAVERVPHRRRRIVACVRAVGHRRTLRRPVASPPVPVDRSPHATGPLQGYELVAHVFVAADAAAADRRHLEGLWHRCVGAFGLHGAVGTHPTELPASAPVVDEGTS